MSRIVNNVACAACGLVCENITVRIDNGKIFAAENACPLCAARLIGQSASGLSSATIDGKSSTVDDAIARAAEILRASKAPLIYGLVGSDVSTQRAAVALADRLGATIDPAIPVFHRAAIEAFQSVGISTCTLGEVKHRADLVVFWGCDPDVTHPSLRERFLNGAGEFVSRRKIVAVNSQRPQGHVDEFFQLPAEQQYTFISLMRALVAGREVSSPLQSELQAFVELFKTANYAAIFIGSELRGVPELEALFQLVRLLNDTTRCVAMGLGDTQIENVLTWQTGYPCSVNFALGYPCYNPHTYSASYLLEHQQVDVVVMVGTAGLEHLSASAKKQFEKLPVILLDDTSQEFDIKPAVSIPIAVPGIHCSGTVFRIDGVPLRLPAIFDSELRTAADVLSAIQQGVLTSCV
jgi:formylmethanofuran dehydrogenase subunit B